ncbi:hypothetical protein P12x_002573 [Tundrisphaera lichenicola]
MPERPRPPVEVTDCGDEGSGRGYLTDDRGNSPDGLPDDVP